MSSRDETLPFHRKTNRMAWAHPTSGKTYHTRSYVDHRASVFAMSAGVRTSSWGPRRMVLLKLHSSQTWKLGEFVTASTQVSLTREDAEYLMVGLQMALMEYDRQELAEMTP